MILFRHAQLARSVCAVRSRAARLAIACVPLTIATGCAIGNGVGSIGRFPQRSPGRVWPAPPDTPRIRYIGQITAAADVGVRAESSLLRAITGATPAPVRFAAPAAIAAAGARLAVADPQHPLGPTVHLIDRGQPASWKQLREAGGAPLEWPMDVAFCEDRLAIADAKRKVILLVNADGVGTTLGAGALQRPSGLAYDPDARELYVADAAAHDIAVFDLGGSLKRRIGRRGAGAGELNFPTAVALRRTGVESELAVADSMNFRVQLLSRDGVPRKAFGQKGDAAGDFALPRDIACDAAGTIYVLDSQFENVQMFDAAGRLLMAFAAGGARPGEFNVPSGMAIDENNWIWVADTRNRRIQAFEFITQPASGVP